MFLTPHSTMPTITESKALMTAPAVIDSITHSLLVRSATTIPHRFSDNTSPRPPSVPTPLSASEAEASSAGSAEGRVAELAVGTVDLELVAVDKSVAKFLE